MNEIRTGDALELLGALPSESVHCCVTSPPYWGLRDYGTGAWKGGSPTCEHKKVTNAQRATAGSTLDGGKKTTGHLQEGFGSTCGRCGARRIDRQLGLESMPEEYIANMVGVFREVKRVLRDDGTAWLNLGDSYAASTGQQTITPQTAYATGRAGGNARGPARKTLDYEKADGGFRDYGGLKPKDLVGIPWRVAFALQAAGWWLRSDIIWSKPNPMPESVTDRPTKAHEMVFLLTKSPRYFFDAEAVREGVTKAGVVEATNGNHDGLVFGQCFRAETAHPALSDGIRLASAVLDLAKRQDQFGLFALDSQVREQEPNGGARLSVIGVPVIRRAASEATRFTDGDISAKEFLEQMNGLCVALPDGDDLKEAWRLAIRNVGHVNADRDRSVAVNDSSKVDQLKFRHDQHDTILSVPLSRKQEYAAANIPGQSAHGYTKRDDGLTSMAPSGSRNIRTVWTIASEPFPEAHFATFPTELARRCILAGCPKGGTVLDPFCGAGTTGLVADRLGRSFIGIELKPEYAEMARRRIHDDAPLLAALVAP